MRIHTELKELINKILTKELTPVKIYRRETAGYFSIEIETDKPKEFISILYTDENKRDLDFNYFDNKVFTKLTFNPYLDHPGTEQVINIKSSDCE